MSIAHHDPGFRVDVNATKVAAMPLPFVRIVVWRGDALAAELALDPDMARALAASILEAAMIVERHSSLAVGAIQ